MRAKANFLPLRRRSLVSLAGAMLIASILPSLPASFASGSNLGLQFDGTNDHVTFGAAPGLGASRFTLELWFKRTGTGVGQQTGSGGLVSAVPLITKGRNQADGSNLDTNYFLGIDTATGKLAVDFEEGATGASPGRNHPLIGDTVVTSNVWHHGAATYDGASWRLYLDGIPNGSLVVGQPPRSDSIQHAALGSALTSTGVAAGFFQGQMDEARIWSVARTGTEIRASIDAEISGSTPGLIGRWGMNEGSGTALGDSSGANVTGTLKAGPGWVAGAPFDLVVDVTPPAPPQDLQASGEAGTISLTWTPSPEPDLAGYNVYRSASSPVSGTGPPLNGALLVTSPGYVDGNVAPGTQYFYVVTAVDTSTNESGISEEAAAAPTQGDPVLVVAGDIANCDNLTDEVTADLVANIPGEVFTLGDNVYPDASLQGFQNCFDPSWGRFKSRIHPVTGNHEYLISGAAGYFAYFGAAAGDPSTGYYGYDVGPSWHVVVLNSECTKIGGCQAGSPQERWLRQDLLDHSDRNVIAMWHKANFSSNANNPSMQPIWQTLYDFGADLVVNGHAHNYERFAPQTPTGQPDPMHGIVEIIAGTGGESHHLFNTIQPNSLVRNSDTFGVLKLTLHPDSYDWRFVPVGGSTFTDAGTTAVHAAPSNTPPVVDSATIDQGYPRTSDTLTVSVTSHDPDGDPVGYSYQWTRNGLDIAGATGAVLSLGSPGSGDRGDQVGVRVTANDGIALSEPVTSSGVTVQNSPPIVTVFLSSRSPRTDDTITATAGPADADGDAATLTYVWKVNGVTTRTASDTTSLTDSLDLSQPGNGDTGDSIAVWVTPSDGTDSGVAASDSATVVDVVNQPPVAQGVTGMATKNIPRTLELSAWDPESNPLAYSVVSGPAHGTVSGGSAAVRTYTPATNFTGVDSFTFRASDGTAESNLATASITVKSPLQVNITQSGFSSASLAPALGVSVKWTNKGTTSHTVTDRSGLGLFDSGPIAPGASFQFTVRTAGVLNYLDSLHPSATAALKPPMTVAPGAGNVSTLFRVTWASDPLPGGLVVDVQILRPGSSGWSNWQTGMTTLSSFFSPDGGTGIYSFQMRLRRPATGAASPYTAGQKITVT